MTATTTNIALVFIKPHANLPGVERLLLQNLEQRHISVVAQGLMTSEDIDKKGVIDKHYFSIARFATMWKPSEIPVTSDSESKFQEAFNNTTWKEAVDSGKLLNASQALDQVFKGDPDLLAAAWGDAKVAKLAPGFYAGWCEREQIWIINGFFIAMRTKFTTPGKSVRWFVVQWSEVELPWSEFRGSVIGATNPEKAAVESVRAQILQRWQELQLPGKPNGSDNGIHASAGPIEGLNERIIWLNGSIAADRFGRALLDAGVDAGLISELLQNPSIHVKGDNVPVFDVLEDQDSSYVVQFLVNYQLAHGTSLSAKASDKDRQAKASAARNYGFLFIKPTQNTTDVQGLVYTKLKNAGIQIKSTADVSGKKIKEENILAHQFSAIHKYATSARASEYTEFGDYEKTMFRSAFGRDFDEARDLQLICNAKEAAERMNLFTSRSSTSAADVMLSKWTSATKQNFLPGLTIGYFADEDLYVVNGFYLAMEAQYHNPSASIRVYHIEWDEARLSWQEFLEITIGNVDPVRARSGSLRSQIYNQWKSLGLQSPPDIFENGVSVSSSPLEALKDRMTWFGGSVHADMFGRTAVACGVPEQTLLAWLQNPIINFGERSGPVMTILRGMDSSKAIRMLAGQKVSSVLSASEKQSLASRPSARQLTSKQQDGIAPDLESRAVVASISPCRKSDHPHHFSPAAKTILTPRRRAGMRSHSSPRSGSQRPQPSVTTTTTSSLSKAVIAVPKGGINTIDGVDVAPPRPGHALGSPRRHTRDRGAPKVDERQRKLDNFRHHDLSTGDLTEEKMREYFSLFDTDGSGVIDRHEFKVEFRKFENFGLTPSPEEVDELFDRYDFRRDGTLSFDEFALLLCHKTQM